MIHWLIHITILILFSFFGSILLKTSLPPWVYWVALVAKLLAGISLGLIFYEYYGFGDTISFFEAAKNADVLSFSGQPRSQFFIQLITPLVYLTGNSYWITSLYLSLFSFISTWYAVQLFIDIYPKHQWVIATSFLFVPSIVFWSSGIMKDVVSFGALHVLISISVYTYAKQRISVIHILCILICLFLLFKIKHYLLITYLFFAGLLFTYSLMKRLPKAWKALSVLVFALFLLSTQYIHPYLKLERIPLTLLQNNQIILEKSTPENRMDIVLKGDRWIDVIKLAPKALHAGIFRPSVLDHTPILGWVHRLENFFLTCLIFLSILIVIRDKPKIDYALLMTALISIGALAVLLAIATPNFGTLVRYKNAYLPYLFMLSGMIPFQYYTSKKAQ